MIVSVTTSAHRAQSSTGTLRLPSGIGQPPLLKPVSMCRAALLSCMAAVVTMTGAVQAADLQVVATGLNNPRGLDFAPNGALYIAEAGTGGNGPTVEGPEGPVRLGLTGSVTRLFKGVQTRLIEGLPSLAGDGGFAAGGPSGISFGKLGTGVLTIGLGLNPAVRDAVLGAQGAMMGSVFQLNPSGKLKFIADVAAVEGALDPDGNGPDSNPTGAWNEPGATFVTDAGGNTLLSIAANGRVSVVAVFPARNVATPPFLPQPPFPPMLSMQSVPTSVVRGPDGALYVSELTGFPFPVGGARVYRVIPGASPQVYATGFTNIIDLEFDAVGNLYVLELDANSLLAPEATGRLVRVNAGTGVVETIVSEGLMMPGGMAIGPDGAIYITNFSTAPGAGVVVRVQP